MNIRNYKTWPHRNGRPLDPEDVNVPSELEEGFEPEEKYADLTNIVGAEALPRNRKGLLAEKFGENFLTFLYSQGKYYKPQEESLAFVRKRQHGFKVIYSIKEDKCVASFWAEYEDDSSQKRPEYIHVDLMNLLEPLLKHYFAPFYEPLSETYSSSTKTKLTN